MVSTSPTRDPIVIRPGSRLPARDRKGLAASTRGLLVLAALAAALLALLSILLFLPIQIPSVVGTYADVTAANKWMLAKGPSGELVARTFNYQTGMSDGYRVSGFESGSSIYFTLTPSMRPGRHVAIGDTVGTVNSSEMQERLVALNGQLAAAEGELAVHATGAK